MIIVIGLGNPGQKYKDHRHNIGFQILDVLASDHSKSFDDMGYVSAAITQIDQLILTKPNT
ncbi:hypothetical protein K2Q02_00755, partial [Patescibacteria group bacterium]|nr:hypothetical protein [Patescibacteria group bacterium]